MALSFPNLRALQWSSMKLATDEIGALAALKDLRFLKLELTGGFFGGLIIDQFDGGLYQLAIEYKNLQELHLTRASFTWTALESLINFFPRIALLIFLFRVQYL